MAGILRRIRRRAAWRRLAVRFTDVFGVAGMNAAQIHVASGAVEWWTGGPVDGTTDSAPRTFEQLVLLAHPDDRELVRSSFERAAEEGRPFSHEYRRVTGDGGFVWRRVSGDVVRDRRGRVTRIIAIGQDISERKEAEERFREMEKLYRTLVEQLPLASYVEQLGAASAGYISPQIAELVGFTAEEWMSDPDFFGKTLHHEDRRRVLEGFSQMHAEGESFGCEYRLIARDGRQVWVYDAAVIVRDEAGDRAYAQGYMIDITDRKLAEQALHESRRELQHQALHDALTGLPNRTLFGDRAAQTLRRAERDGGAFAVMVLDLDRFKDVNDTLGHEGGDVLLRTVAERLEGVIRRSDSVARLGGDEFAVLAPGIGDRVAALALAEKMAAALAQPIVIEGLTLELEASIGIALFPEHGVDVEELTRHADVSMYVSKLTHTPVVYAEEHKRDSLSRLQLISELRDALAGRQLAVEYQPQASAATGETVKVEALVRWHHPERGLLSPDAFVPLAEQTGLIRSLTHFVLDSALEQCHRWNAAGRRVAIAVNVTGRELIDLAFPAEVAELLAKWNVEPELLELEITETTIMADAARAIAVLTELRQLGIRIAVDDFGSGESSFSYLRRLPIDVLKVDKSYVLAMLESREDHALVRSAIELGHNLGLEVVAEGVETAEVRTLLEELGCDVLQGFHIGRPQPEHQLQLDTEALAA